MNLSDSHLEDPRSNRELRSEEAARELRDVAVLKRKREILASESEMVHLLTEYPSTFAKVIMPMMGENYEDAVPMLRYWISNLAEYTADKDTMSIDAFKREE